MKHVVAIVALCACASGCGSASTTSATSTTSSTTTTTPTSTTSSTFTLTGIVSDQQTARGIQSAAVQVSSGPNANKAAVTAADGSYSLPGLAAGDLTLVIAATGYTSLTKTMTLAADTRLDAALQSTSRTINGTVTDGTSGGILPNILVTVVGGPSDGKSARTDSSGNYAIAGVVSDPVTLTASATSYTSVSKAAAAGGNTRVDFVLPRVVAPASTPSSGSAASITFGGVGGGLPYTESGYTVVSTLGTWFVSSYGAPGPSIQFSTPAGVTTTAEVKITAAGAAFRFASVDLYSSTTPIPYVFTGLSNGVTMFAVSGQQGNTFGNFVTVANAQSGVAIDTLLIRLSNPAAACCANPMGIDNGVLVK